LLLAGSTLAYTPVDKVLEQIESILPISEPKSAAPASPGFPADNLESASLGDITLSSDVEVGSQPVYPVLAGQVAATYRIQDVEIPVSTEYIETDQLLPGTSRVQEQGTAGVERQVIRTMTVGGEISEEQIIHQFVRDAPKKRVVMQNTKPVILSQDIDISGLNAVKSFTVEATAYTYTGNPTATGVYPREGLIAVDPRVIPLGTQVYVEGYGYAVAADTGGAIKGNIIDVFFPSLKRCLEWGRRPVTIHILAGN